MSELFRSFVNVFLGHLVRCCSPTGDAISVEFFRLRFSQLLAICFGVTVVTRETQGVSSLPASDDHLSFTRAQQGLKVPRFSFW